MPHRATISATGLRGKPRRRPPVNPAMPFKRRSWLRREPLEHPSARAAAIIAVETALVRNRLPAIKIKKETPRQLVKNNQANRIRTTGGRNRAGIKVPAKTSIGKTSIGRIRIGKTARTNRQMRPARSANASLIRIRLSPSS
jgi:hypothetical protein